MFQKLGLELRKIGNADSLYNEVDLVLSKNNIDSSGISLDVQNQTAAHALNKMLKVEKYFSVCTIQNLSELCQIMISKERALVYSSIHCMEWSEMTQDYRQMIIAMVLDDFRMIFQQIEDIQV